MGCVSRKKTEKPPGGPTESIEPIEPIGREFASIEREIAFRSARARIDRARNRSDRARAGIDHQREMRAIEALSVPDYTGGARVTRLRRQTDTDTRPEWTFCLPSFSPELGSLDR